MKKSSFITSLAFAFVMLLSFNAEAQKFSPLDKSPLDLASFSSEGGKAIKVFYSRPYLKGRTIGTDLAKYGKLWRTGANDATQIQFLQDMKFAGKTIKAGAYSLFTIPGEKEWTIIISSVLDQWATRGYNESNEVARLTVPATKGEESLENFSIAFASSDNGATMHMGWGTVRVAVPFTK
ncbi:DUF2911 domain-containing protein [Winogradskyella immobilis]|uniref:DUF2911 domain-containing protein n=1 Tax=Winogradskyella immobilis TaxID=2816852 RepID=A0ABS8EQV4_9FLAO|nr:DUF2911 domain-containing protein [Winogradskyella immobilis]MCC1485490.1 DUF2911 domain-containing protein [Winogradskyella immobilis]MCG0017582.1 DUF2911 domain-containing protein [Winogradskyella immobilis]